MPITVLGEGLTPEDAAAYWKSKVPMTNKEAMALTEEARKRAFYAAGLAKLDQVNLIHGALLQALEQGQSVEDFKKNIAEIIQKAGWDGRRIETIFNTNMQTAYQAGRWKSIEKNKKRFPYLQYSSVIDNRTRASHAALHGIVYPVDHVFWNSHYPPNGFNCRCTAVQISKYYAEKEGLKIQNKMPGHLKYTDPKTGNEYTVTDLKPDIGFANNVGKDWLQTIETPLFDKLEKTETKTAQKFVEYLVKEQFEEWRKDPNIDFPVAVLTKEQGKIFATAITAVRLSKDTMIKQDKHHPELTLEDYLKIQEAVNKSEMYRQNENSYAFILEEKDGIVCIIKVTKEKDKLYLTSIRKLSERSEAKRNKAIQQIKRGQQKKE